MSTPAALSGGEFGMLPIASPVGSGTSATAPMAEQSTAAFVVTGPPSVRFEAALLPQPTINADVASIERRRTGSKIAHGLDMAPGIRAIRARSKSLTDRGLTPISKALRSGAPLRWLAVTLGIDATMLLCDSAQAVAGKLYVLGGGWSQIGPPQPAGFTMALAIRLTVPWDRANEQFRMRAALVTADAEPVDLGGGPISAEGDFEVGRPPGLRPGTPLDSTLALNFAGLTLEPGGYVWQLELGGDIVARTAFRVVGP